MRLLITLIILTFVVLKNGNAAPQSNTTLPSVIDAKELVNDSGDDYLPEITQRHFKFYLGGIAGEFGDNKPENWHYLVSLLKKQEISFERYFFWGISLTSNQMLEVKTQIDFGSLFLSYAPWNAFGVGVSQFVIGQDGFSNLVNVNQTKFVTYANLGSYFQAQAFYGLNGLAYSISFQSGF